MNKINQIDDKSQAKRLWQAKFNLQNRLIQIQFHDKITYLGKFTTTAQMNVQKVINKIQKGQVEIISQTTTKVIAQLGFLTIHLQSEDFLEIIKLKEKIKILENQIKQPNMWEKVDLQNKQNFDLDCIYKVKLSSGYSHLIGEVYPTHLRFYLNGTNYHISSNSRHITSQSKNVLEIKMKKV